MTELTYRTGRKPVWCPGCGDFGVFASLTKAMKILHLPNHETVVFSGIGCSSRIAGYVDVYGFNLLHGRSVPAAIGAKLAKPKLTVLSIGGDGDLFSIGCGHIPHAVRSNVDITVICIDNFVYGLTKGQNSPTTPLCNDCGLNNNDETSNVPIDPISMVIASSMSAQSSFVAQGLDSDVAHLAELFVAGIRHKGFSFINVITDCTTYRKEMYLRIKEECTPIDPEHNPHDIDAALKMARISMEGKPYLGVFFEGNSIK